MLPNRIETIDMSWHEFSASNTMATWIWAFCL
jgi:hypothetical protein